MLTKLEIEMRDILQSARNALALDLNPEDIRYRDKENVILKIDYAITDANLKEQKQEKS